MFSKFEDRLFRCSCTHENKPLYTLGELEFSDFSRARSETSTAVEELKHSLYLSMRLLTNLLILLINFFYFASFSFCS